MDILAMSRRIPFFGFFGGSASDDDFADRLNYKYTVAILVVFAFVVTNKHFGHNQINCWVPALFSKNFEEYTNLVCWITNTYYIPFDKQIPNDEPERRSTELRYYQWVAYILLILALLFYLPRIIWRTLSLRSGVDIKDVIEASYDFKSVSKLEKNQKMMEYMIGTIDQYVDDPRRQSKNRKMNCVRKAIALSCFMFGKFLGNYLVILYLFVKILYITNCVGQLFLISVLLGRNYYIYGASIFRDMIQGKGYADSEYFPRVTMCKFQVRELGLKNFSHEYNVQCVLPINLFNQQIFTFLWFWYLILFIINTSALFIWIYRFIPRNQYNYTIRRIKLLRVSMMEQNKTAKTSISSLTSLSSSLRNLSSKSSKKLRWEMESNEMSDDHGRAKNASTARSDSQGRRDSYQFEEEFEVNENNTFYETKPVNKAKQNDGNLRNRSSPHDDNDSYSDMGERRPYQPRAPRPQVSPNPHHPQFSNEFSSYNQCGHRNNMQYKPDGHRERRADPDTPKYMNLATFCVKNYKAFVYEYLESDGMFMLRMIASHSGDFVCTQVIHNLWKLYLFKNYKQSLKQATSGDENESRDDSSSPVSPTSKATKLQYGRGVQLAGSNLSFKKRSFLSRVLSKEKLSKFGSRFQSSTSIDFKENRARPFFYDSVRQSDPSSSKLSIAEIRRQQAMTKRASLPFKT